MKKHGTANAVVRARINEKVKNQAAAVLETMGLTVSDAFRLLLVKVAAEKTFPFEIQDGERVDGGPECGRLSSNLRNDRLIPAQTKYRVPERTSQNKKRRDIR